MVLENWTDSAEEMKQDHLFTPHTRTYWKWIKDLNVTPETINIPEENIGSKISDTAYSSMFSDISPQARETKEKNQWDYIKLKSFCTAKEIIKIKR